MPMPSSIELAQAQAALQTGSRSFHLASRLLPRRVRHPAAVLYAFCREADDLVDDGGGTAALAHLRGRVQTLHQAALARDQLLAGVMAQHQIPDAVLFGLLDGFALDVAHRQPDDLDQLIAYAIRVAGTVGIAMALVMGVRERAALQAALALGVAMQLTNICRDVGEDAAIGRTYLPRDWMLEAGMDVAAWRAHPVADGALRQVITRVLAQADQFYAVADAGLATLPADCRVGITAARRLYAGIGHALRTRGCDAVSQRTVLGPLAKLACMVRPAAVPCTPAEAAACAATLQRLGDFLLQACPPPLQPVVVREQKRAQNRVPGSSGQRAQPWGVGVIDLFERLEQRAREQQAANRGRGSVNGQLDWRT